MNNNNSSNATGVNGSNSSKPAKPKKEKPMTPSLFCKQTGKFFSEKPDTIRLREYVKQNKDFILNFDFGSKILDEGLDDKQTLSKLCEKFFELSGTEVKDKLASAEKKAEETKKKQGVIASIFAQVWDKKKREYVDNDYDIVIVINDEGKEKKLVESFPTEHEAARWAANQMVKMMPGFRHKAVITDMRGENVYTREMTYDEADKIKSLTFKGTQVTKTLGSNVPNKPQMKVNASKQSFSRG